MQRTRTHDQTAAFDHGEPFHRPQSLPILLFAIALIAGLTAFNGRQTHAFTIDLPNPDAEADTRLGVPTDLLSVTADGTTRWNGKAVSRVELARVLEASARREDRVRLNFLAEPDAAYGEVAQVLAMAWRAGLTRRDFCFADIDRHRHFGAEPGDDLSSENEPGAPCRYNGRQIE